jgi:hypothetical protein
MAQRPKIRAFACARVYKQHCRRAMAEATRRNLDFFTHYCTWWWIFHRGAGFKHCRLIWCTSHWRTGSMCRQIGHDTRLVCIVSTLSTTCVAESTTYKKPVSLFREGDYVHTVTAAGKEWEVGDYSRKAVLSLPKSLLAKFIGCRKVPGIGLVVCAQMPNPGLGNVVLNSK